MGNESFANAERDIEILTGVRIPHSTQHRLVANYQLPEPKITKRAEAFSFGEIKKLLTLDFPVRGC